MKRWLIVAVILMLPITPAFSEQARVFQDNANILVAPPNEDPAASAAVSEALIFLRQGNKAAALVRLRRLAGTASQSPRVQTLLRILTATLPTPAPSAILPTPAPTLPPPELMAGLGHVRAAMAAGDYQGALIRLEGLARRYGRDGQVGVLRGKIFQSDKLPIETIAWIEAGWQGGHNLPPGVAAVPTPAPTPRPALQRSLLAAVTRADWRGIDASLAQGAALNAVDDAGGYALDTAISKRPGLVLALLRRGADPNPPPRHVAALPLAAAAVHGDTAMLETLLHAGARVNERDRNGRTALQALLADPSWGRQSEEPVDLAKVRVLLAAGADMRQPDGDGKAALPIALDNPDFPQRLIELLSAPKPQAAIADYLKARTRHPEAPPRTFNPANVAPLAVLNSETRLDSVGTPEVTVRVLNAGRATINGYRITFHCWDADGRPVVNLGSSSYLGVADSPLLPGEQTKNTWVLSGFEKASRVTYDVVYIRYQDGKVWQH